VSTHEVSYPGAERHQVLLRAVVGHYRDDPRILAVAVFGSLGRGNWDAYSDLDLDVVIADEARLDASSELIRLGGAFAALGDPVAVTVPDGDDAGDLVLESLMGLSIRYHPLARTSPNIVDSLRLLAGRLTAAEVAAAGRANQRPAHPPLGQLVDEYVRYAVDVRTCILRERHWLALEILHRMRAILQEIFTRAHGGLRAHQTFEERATPAAQARLAATLPQFEIASLRDALERMLAMLEDDLEALSDGQVSLNPPQRAIIRRIRDDLRRGSA
jgi:predicted nucleotidyltransferase